MKRDASSIRSLVSLGMPERYVEKIHQILHGRAGLIVFAGPTGCGKSTTIYSILNEFDPLEYNIQTAESPIEVVIPHVNQVEISDFGRNTFLNWVRGIVREAPDILMMGEIRDLETADSLLRVVNTGTSGHYHFARQFGGHGADPIFATWCATVPDRLDASNGPLPVSGQDGLSALRRGSTDSRP